VSERDEKPLVIEPGAERWRAMLRRPPAEALEMRRELGLPTDRPIIMTGHQAVFWHPGILVKYLAADEAAAALGARAAWVVVDHDTDDPWVVRYPARDGAGRLAAKQFDLRTNGERAGKTGDVAVYRRASISPARDMPTDAVNAGVEEGLLAIRNAAAAHTGEPNAALQVAKAVGELLVLRAASTPMVFSSKLSGTALFGRVLAAMEHDPRACIAAYNLAVASVPGAGLRPLYFDKVNERYELPLWRIVASGARTRVHAEDVGGVARGELAPRALLMTALLRLGACDLFIHGTGGSLYERANDAWISGWLAGAAGGGEAAPVAVVTATRRLPLMGGEPPTARDVARAKWAAHHARHDPGMLGDEAGAALRRELVAAIKSARRVGKSPRRAFEELHEFLKDRRATGGDRLRALEQHAAEVSGRALDAAVASDRTWAFPLYPREIHSELRREIMTRFGGGAC